MSVAVLVLQVLVALVAAVSVAQRCRVLLFVAPLSPALLRELTAALARSEVGRARSLAAATAQAWPSRLVLLTLSAPAAERLEQLASEQAELSLLAQAQLGLIRVSATLASTLGLIGGILAIQRGFSGQGLLALRAGLAHQVAVSEVLDHMAIGVGTAAFCFAAFGLLRRAAVEAQSQTTRLAAACRDWAASASP